MSAAKVTPELDVVAEELEIAAPPQRIFQALTEAHQLFTWWGAEPTVEVTVFKMDARKGGTYEYRSKPKAGVNFGEVGEQLKKNAAGEFVCHGEVLEIDPPRLLVWSWLANWHQHPEHSTTVRWDLASTARGTRVRVAHSGLENEPVCRKDYGQGWAGVLKLLKKYLER